MPHRLLAAFAATSALLLLTGCTTASETGSTPSPTPSRSIAPETSATPTPQLAEPTCENIMSSAFTTDWIAEQVEAPHSVFAEGITCRWQADPTVATDNILAYSWAPATEADWEALVTEHTTSDDSPWFVESGPRDQYLTHKTEYWVQDDNGYGATFLFTGDVLIYAMTKAETDYVTGPPLGEG